MTLNMKASLGSPWSLYYASPRAFLEKGGIGLVRDKYALLKQLSAGIELAGCGVENALSFDMMCDGEIGLIKFFDPVRMFVKPEPHSFEKLQNQKYRLISSVSIVDNLLDKWLLGEFVMWEKSLGGPSMVGTDMSSDEQCLQIYNDFRSPKALWTDVSNWDWGHPMELFDANRELLLMIFDFDHEVSWKRKFGDSVSVPEHPNRPMLDLYLKMVDWEPCWEFRDSNGECLGDVRAHSMGPIQKSGHARTSADNSRKRAVLSTMVGILAGKPIDFSASWPLATMGDDCKEDLEVDDPVSEYAKLGVKLKTSFDGDFCGKDLRTGALTRPFKTWYGAVTQYEPCSDPFNDSMWELRHWPELYPRLALYGGDVVDRVKAALAARARLP
jgi:hypothetical protein